MHHFGQVFKTCSQSEASRNASMTMETASITASVRHSSCRFDCEIILHSASSEQTLCTSKRFDLRSSKGQIETQPIN